MLRSALFSKMKAWNPNGKLCGRMDVQNLSVLERYILDGMSQIRGALASTTPHELSNTSIKSKSPHKEGHTKTAFIKNPGHQWSQCPPPSPQQRSRIRAIRPRFGRDSGKPSVRIFAILRDSAAIPLRFLRESAVIPRETPVAGRGKVTRC